MNCIILEQFLIEAFWLLFQSKNHVKKKDLVGKILRRLINYICKDITYNKVYVNDVFSHTDYKAL